MKAAAGPDMVGVILATKITPPPGSTQLFAWQEPDANTKAPRGSTLKIYIYQSLAGAAVIPSPTPSTSMPDLTGLTLEQAVAQLPPKTQVLADEMGEYPPTPEKALTIFSQTPAKGAPLAPVVTVKRYGSAKIYDASTDPLAGKWVGVSIYKDKEVEMLIRREGGRYVIYVVGNEFGYPLETDGVRMWHTFTIYNITYQLEGDALVGKWRYTDIKGGEHTGQTTFRRK